MYVEKVKRGVCLMIVCVLSDLSLVEGESHGILLVTQAVND